MKGGINMPSILPATANDFPCVPIEVFQEEIRDAIKQKTGEEFTIEELQDLDMGDIERILGIQAKRPTKIRRGDPSSLYEFRSPENVAYNRAVVNSSLMKKN